METFETQFFTAQKRMNDVKRFMLAKRALAIQARSKIKPTSLNPDLLTMSKMRGGDSIAPVTDSLDLFYPS
jgi:hypothetical protein